MLSKQYNRKCIASLREWSENREDKLMFNKFELGYKASKRNRNICYVKGEIVVDHFAVTRWFQKSCSGWKNLDSQGYLGKAKSENSEAWIKSPKNKSSQSNSNSIRHNWHLTVLNGSSLSRPQQIRLVALRVSGELEISLPSVACHLHDLGKYGEL